MHVVTLCLLLISAAFLASRFRRRRTRPIPPHFIHPSNTPSPRAIPQDHALRQDNDVNQPIMEGAKAPPSAQAQRNSNTSQSEGKPTGSMPPPPRPFAMSNQRVTTVGGLSSRTPNPAPYRGPPRPSTLAPTLLAPSATLTPGLVTKSSGRQKVILKPGHSPLDWAALTNSGEDLSGVPHLQKVTPSQLAYHNGRKGRPIWSSWQGKVYNVGPYLPFHPGGEDQLKRAAGKSADKLFNEVHPWVNWENMLGECLVGVLVSEGTESSITPALEEMD